ncbi:MAG: hypothetical protein HY329_18545 [Chloroflexi bacterium]|nr:hypothetical protein [Chloroflexota bacterium]
MNLLRGFSSLRSLFQVVRSLDLGPIDADLERPCTIAVVGEDVYRQVILRLLHPAPSLRDRRLAVVGWDPATGGTDAAVVVQVASASDDPPPHLFVNVSVVRVGLGVATGAPSWHPDVALPEATPAAAESRLAPAILHAVPDCAPSLARRIPVLRREAAHRVVVETCAGNAEMVFMSNFLSAVPVIGNLIEAGGDTISLTTNQIIMLHKLGGIYGRDFHDRRRLFMEILPVVGAALGFRTVAQVAVDLVPTPFAVAPKVGVAYAGTYSVGRIAIEYYREGYKPTLNDARARFAEGLTDFRRWFDEHRPRLTRERSQLEPPKEPEPSSPDAHPKPPSDPARSA